MEMAPHYPDHSRYCAAPSNITREDSKLPVGPWENTWDDMRVDVTSIHDFRQEMLSSRFTVVEPDYTFSHCPKPCNLAVLPHQSSSFSEQNMFLDNGGWSYDSHVRPSSALVSPLNTGEAQHFSMGYPTPSTTPRKATSVSSVTSYNIKPHTPQSLPSTTDGSDSEAEPIMIGSVYARLESNNYMFKCSKRACVDKTYGRWYDLKRHYEGSHAVNGAVFWCSAKGCVRSQGRGNRSFPRKDKMRDHMRKKHKV